MSRGIGEGHGVPVGEWEGGDGVPWGSGRGELGLPKIKTTNMKLSKGE